MRFPGVLLAATACVALAGCGEGSSGGTGDAGSKALGELDPVAVGTSSLAATFSIASAPGLYSLLAFPILVATASTGACPVVSQDENGTTVTGGCTDGDGTSWTGEMRMLGFTDVEIELDAFGFASATSCNAFSLPGTATFEGRARVFSETGNTTGFEQDFTMTPGEPCGRYDRRIAIDYEGTVVNGPDTDLDGTADSSTWTGDGRVGLEGIGRVRATTEDERLDGIAIGPAGTVASGPGPEGACFDEPASGVTRFRASGVVTQLDYDGATSCEGGVPWSIDGTPQFTQITNVSCSATADRGGSALAVLGLLAIAVSAGFRRTIARFSVRRPGATSRSSR